MRKAVENFGEQMLQRLSVARQLRFDSHMGEALVSDLFATLVSHGGIVVNLYPEVDYAVAQGSQFFWSHQQRLDLVMPLVLPKRDARFPVTKATVEAFLDIAEATGAVPKYLFFGADSSSQVAHPELLVVDAPKLFAQLKQDHIINSRPQVLTVSEVLSNNLINQSDSLVNLLSEQNQIGSLLSATYTQWRLGDERLKPLFTSPLLGQVAVAGEIEGIATTILFTT